MTGNCPFLNCVSFILPALHPGRRSPLFAGAWPFVKRCDPPLALSFDPSSRSVFALNASLFWSPSLLMRPYTEQAVRPRRSHNSEVGVSA